MKKTRNLAFAAFVLFLILGMAINGCNHQNAHLHSYADDIEDHLRPIEKQVMEWLPELPVFWQENIEKVYHNERARNEVLVKLEAMRTRPFMLFVFKADSLVYWSKNASPILPVDSLRQQIRLQNSHLVRLANGYFEYIEREFRSLSHPDQTFLALCLIPVKNEFKLNSTYLSNRFHANRSIPEEVHISYEPTPFEVRSYDGQPLFYLRATGEFKDSFSQTVVLILFLLAAVCLAVFLNGIARLIVRKNKPWLGAAFLILTIVLLRMLSFHFGFMKSFENLPVFSQTFDTPVLNYSLGDLLIDIVLLLWLMVFFHREFRVKPIINIARQWQFLLTILNYFSIILGILMVTSVFKSLVLDSGIVFDFDNVLQLDVYSILAILGVIMLLFALFLFSHRMMLTIEKTGLPRKQRLMSLFSSMLLSLPLIWVTDLGLPFWHLALASSLFILLFDLYIDNKSSGIVWLGTWLVFFAAFSATLLFKYNEDKDLRIRCEYAEKLAEWKDDHALEDFKEFTEAVEHDKDLSDLLFDSTFRTEHRQQLEKQINSLFSNYVYLFNIYTYRYSLDDVIHVGASEDPKNLHTFDKAYFFSKLKEAKSTSHPDILLWAPEDQMFTYIAAIFIRNPAQSGQGKFLYFEIEKRLREPSMVYTELVLTQYFKNLNNLHRYDYAIYKNNHLVEENRPVFDKDLNEEMLPQRGEWIDELIGERTELTYHAPDGTVVIVGREFRGLLKPLSLFSYLFILFILSSFFLAVINTLFNFLPEAIQLNFWKKPSLKSKIQIAVILIIITSFVMIAVVTVIYFQNTSEDYHENRLFRKLQSLLMDTEHDIQEKAERSREEVNAYQLAKAASTIHRMDVNLYGLDGKLISSSEMDIFNKNLVAPMMGGIAYHALANQGRTDVVQNEKIGSLEYKAAYAPLRGPDGNTLAYVGLPYYAKRRDLRDDVSDFMGALLNVYVLLLLIASSIAILIANSITKPLVIIGEQFKRFKLGGKNEPLYWNSRDELGELIAEFNRMVKEAEESADKLKLSERDAAWRTMAQQVAHEIKNPLTPMKLSIQYLQHAVKSDPKNIQPLFDRVAHTLTEQIENLAEIATSFSDFAKMPKPQNHTVLLNDVVDSVYGLFEENKEVDVVLHPVSEDFYVYVDKNQMIRVFNNIISNAIQAIPQDRRGKIEISMAKEGNYIITRIKDNGAGIPENMRDKIFLPQFTTKTSGMGLGLAMCKDIVEMAGGKIFFTTVMEEGTTFHVVLPIVDPPEQES